MSDVSHLGDFRCAELTPPQLDGVLAFALNKRDLEDARSLFASKWWDYRFIHLGHSYFLFAQLFGDTTEHWRTKFGVSVHAKLKATDNPVWRTERAGERGYHVLSPAAHRTGLFRAMCFADQYGVPYEKWINWVFEDAFEHQWTRLPTPTQLYSDRTVEHVLEKWEAEQRDLMAVPKDPRYQIENFVGDPTQVAFQKWLLGWIKQRPNPVQSLIHFLKIEPMIDVDIARQVLGNAIVGEALRRL